MIKGLLITCLMATFLLGCGNQQSDTAATAPVTANQAKSAAPSTQQPAPQNGSKVVLAWSHVPLEEVAPLLSHGTGKTVLLSPLFKAPKLWPKYTLTLLSSEVMTVDEAHARVIAKLRSDGLDVREDEKTIEIGPGDYLNVWKPE